MFIGREFRTVQTVIYDGNSFLRKISCQLPTIIIEFIAYGIGLNSIF